MITSCKRTDTSFSFFWGAICLSVALLLILGTAIPAVEADQIASPPVADTYVAEGRNTNNFAGRPTLWVGYDQVEGFLRLRSLLGFDPASIPAGSKITSATLRLYLAWATEGDEPMTVRAHRVRGAWDETAITWENHLGLTIDPAAPAASTSVPSTLGWYAWDVTTALQAWSDARDTAAFSLILQSELTSGQHERSFWSKDCNPAQCGSNQPRLEITYDLPATPTPTRTPTPTATPTGAWANWREPNQLILLPPTGKVDVVLDYHNAPQSTTLSAGVTGAAVFQDSGMPNFAHKVQGSGSYALTLKAKAGALPGAPFYLSAQVGAFVLQPDPRNGAIARQVYLPMILRNWSPPAPATSAPTNTPTSTETPTATPTSSATPSETPSATPTNTPPSTPAAAPTTIMVLVPAGEFQMGCDPAHNGGFSFCPLDQEPLHTVHLDAYRIDLTEVTNAQYAACVTAGGCTAPYSSASKTRSSYHGNPAYDNYPVIHVDRQQAANYCAWMRKRLPTEAEWEKAARGASSLRIYPWGSESPECSLASFLGCVEDTEASGSHPSGASPYGALDMAGNVREWVNDWYGGDYYGSSPYSNPTGPATGTEGVLRGGGWQSQSFSLLTADRDKADPTHQDVDLGFRCAASE